MAPQKALPNRPQVLDGGVEVVIKREIGHPLDVKAIGPNTEVTLPVVGRLVPSAVPREVIHLDDEAA